MEKLQTTRLMDLFLGSCLGLEPRAPALTKYLANMIDISNFVLKNCFGKQTSKRKKTPTKQPHRQARKI